MTWKCQLLNIVGTKTIRYDPPNENGLCGETLLVDADGKEYHFREMPIGSMFCLPKNPTHEGENSRGNDFSWPWHLAREEWISDYYRQNNSHRQPLFVILPGRNLFVIDGKCWSDGKHYGGWQVTGEAPLITVHPSINIGGSYHGWLKNGVIDDDCEGRKFDILGNPILPNKT